MIVEAVAHSRELAEDGNRSDAVALLRAVSAELEKRWTESLVTSPSSSAGLASQLAKAQARLDDEAGQALTLKRIDGMIDRQASLEDRCVAKLFLASMWQDLDKPENIPPLLAEIMEIAPRLPRIDGDRNPYLGMVLSVAGKQAELGWFDEARATLDSIRTRRRGRAAIAISDFRAVLSALEIPSPESH